MRKPVLLAAAALLLASLAGSAHAARPGDGPGLGFILGEPTGISFKSSLRERGAWDAAAAWSFEGEGYLHLHADFLFHQWNRPELKVEEGALAFYYGIGGRVVFRDDDPRLGVRVPLGLAYLIEDTPLEFFGEVVPVLDVAPETEFRVNGGLGLRWWFD